jgi:hypothetical protein
MGNVEHDACEIKAINIIKNVPILSEAYRWPRAIIYKAKGTKM